MKGSFLILLTEHYDQQRIKTHSLSTSFAFCSGHFHFAGATSPWYLHANAHTYIPASRRDAVQEVELECTLCPEELQIKKVSTQRTHQLWASKPLAFQSNPVQATHLNLKNMWKRMTFIIHWQGRVTFRNCNKLIICKRANIIRWVLIITIRVRHSRMGANSQTLRQTLCIWML